MLPKWNLADIRSRMFNTPLMVSRDRALTALGVMGPKLDVRALLSVDGKDVSVDHLRAQVAPSLKSEMDELPGDDGLKKYVFIDGMLVEVDPYEVWNGVAILPVRGTLMAEHGIDPASGATGYDGLSRKARHAAANAEVKGAVLDIDSGGGEVIDLLELCTELRSFAEKKPLRAVVRGSACSAAYALAACAGEGNITAAPYSIVGSIGAIMMHADFSKQLEQEGIDVTLITSADHKADASWTKPLDKQVKAKLDGMVKDCAASFIDHVVDARSTDRQAVLDQQAAFFSGQEALSLGLVDKFMPWSDSMKEFAEGLNARPGSRASHPAPTGASSTKGQAMSDNANAPAAESQPEITEAALADATAKAKAEGVTEGANAEQERITALAELDAGSTISEPLAAAIADGSTVADFALAQARAKKDTVAAAAAAAKSDAVTTLPEGSASAADPAKPAETNRGKAYTAKKQAKG